MEDHAEKNNGQGQASNGQGVGEELYDILAALGIHAAAVVCEKYVAGEVYHVTG